jgi:PP-loop superfamily ATP-utilizing enzyme
MMTRNLKGHKAIGVLFSGGVDSTLVALLVS